MSMEALAAGQQLAVKLGVGCWAAVIGKGAETLAGELVGKNLAKVHTVTHPLLEEYTADGYVAALEQLVKKGGAVTWCFRTRTRFGTMCRRWRRGFGRC